MVMPRPKSNATKMAFKILGKPANFDYKRPKALEKVENKLRFDETMRVR